MATAVVYILFNGDAVIKENAVVRVLFYMKPTCSQHKIKLYISIRFQKREI